MENNESIDNQDNISFIDSHCHLQDYSQEDLDIILNHCSNNNIKVFIQIAHVNQISKKI